MKNFSILIILIALTSCTDHSRLPATAISMQTPGSITVWGRSFIQGTIPLPTSPPVATDQQLANIAQAHCQRYNKNATLSHKSFVLGARTYTFTCTPK